MRSVSSSIASGDGWVTTAGCWTRNGWLIRAGCGWVTTVPKCKWPAGVFVSYSFRRTPTAKLPLVVTIETLPLALVEINNALKLVVQSARSEEHTSELQSL